MWEIVTIKNFDKWFLALNESEQIDVLASIELLQVKGPQLGRPHADTLEDTHKVKNLKELRIQHHGKPFRVFYAFDPKRKGYCSAEVIRQETNAFTSV